MNLTVNRFNAEMHCPTRAGAGVRGDRCVVKLRGTRLTAPLLLAAATVLPGTAHASLLADATSTTLIICGSFVSSMTRFGAASEDCLVAPDATYSRAEGSVRTALGERPLASVTALSVGEPNKFKSAAQTSARLTYELRLVEMSAAPMAVGSVPISAWVRGGVSRESQLANAPVNSVAIGAAYVAIRSNPGIAYPNGDILNERAVRVPQNPAQDTPDFDKTVSIRLVPGQTYLVDLTASCRISGGAGGRETVASSSSCSSMADASFSFDQAAFDQQLGASSFSLAAYYRFEYSPGIAQPVPEPGTATMMLLGLAAWTVYARRRHA